jgi:hypothetical protein
MINRNNYEAYLMDYIDGKLNAVEVSEVLLFLEQYPHIKEELNGLKEIHLSEQDLPGPDFSLLMKPTYKDEKQKFETLIISKLEGEISEENSSILQKGLLIYPELTHDIYLFEQTKLTPDTSIVFPNKHALKKGGWAVPLWQNWYSRAAAIALLDPIGYLRKGLSCATKSKKHLRLVVNFWSTQRSHRNPTTINALAH